MFWGQVGLPFVVLFAWVYALIWLMTNEHYTSLLLPKFLPFLLGSLVITTAFMMSTLRMKANQHNHLDSEMWVKGGILIIPLVFLFGISDNTLGSFALTRRSLATGVSASDRTNSVMNREDDDAGRPDVVDPDEAHPVETDVFELIRNSADYLGKTITLTGMFYNDERLEGNSFILFRFALTCCVADAQPALVVVESPYKVSLSDDEWVRVSGVVELPKRDSEQGIVIRAQNINKIPQPSPRDQYLLFE